MKSNFVIFIFLLNSVYTLPVMDETHPASSTTTEKITTIIVPDTTSSTTTVQPEITSTTTHRSRPLILFDQRQEGKYNIRADLENLMFVMIPSNPKSSLSLLDLLTRSAVKRNYAKHANKRIKSANNRNQHNEQQQQQQQQHQESSEFGVSENTNNKRVLDEFVEGRTPYKVDISSTETGTNNELQVLPMVRSPIVHHIKPVPLEIESPITSTRSSTGNFHQLSSLFPVVTVGSQRKIKSLTELNNEFNTNSIVRIIDLDGTQRGFTDINDSFENLNIDNLDKLRPQFTDGWELKLIGSEEQCGPDRRRDSYGVCQFIPTI